jgi:hypothetical protein
MLGRAREGAEVIVEEECGSSSINKKGDEKSVAFPQDHFLNYYFLLTSSKSASTTSSCPLGRGPSWGPGPSPAPGPADPF